MAQNGYRPTPTNPTAAAKPAGPTVTDHTDEILEDIDDALGEPER